MARCAGLRCVTEEPNDYNSMEAFKGTRTYSPLQRSDIRVVKFRPYSPTLDNYTRIEGKLSHIPLDATADFFALSYVWGDPNVTRTISLDGKDFPVTNNLWWAILYVRNRYNIHREPHNINLPPINIDKTGECDKIWPNYAIYWWIDAICINQADVAERSREVPRMKELYSTATRVVIWLGQVDDEKSDPSTVRVVLAAEKNYQAIAGAGGPEGQDVSVDQKIEILAKEVGNPGDLIRPMVTILNNSFSWYSRVWTLQEAVLAREDPAVMVGKQGTSIQRLRLLQTSLSATLKTGKYDKQLLRHDLNVMGTPEFDTIAMWGSRIAQKVGDSVEAPKSSLSRNKGFAVKARKLRLILLWGKEKKLERNESASALEQFARELLELLCTFASRKATVQHDRIYGLLGLTSLPPLPDHLKPDYLRSYEEVCFDYTKFIIQSTGSLHVLALGANRLQGWPTWVPDYSVASHGQGLYNTAYKVLISEDGKCLTVRGVMLGEVVAVHNDQALRAMDPKEIPSDVQIINAWTDLAMNVIQPASKIRCCDVDSVLEEWASQAFVEGFGGKLDALQTLRTVIKNGKTGRESWDHRASLLALGTLFQFSTYILLDNGTICHWYHQPNRLEEVAITGDYICALKGTNQPTILRPRRNKGGFIVAGACWLYPVMSNTSTFHPTYFEENVQEDFLLY